MINRITFFINFQVHAKPISIHAPMTRLLAGLSLFMEKFELDLSSSHELVNIQLNYCRIHCVNLTNAVVICKVIVILMCFQVSQLFRTYWKNRAWSNWWSRACVRPFSFRRFTQECGGGMDTPSLIRSVFCANSWSMFFYGFFSSRLDKLEVVFWQINSSFLKIP